MNYKEFEKKVRSMTAHDIIMAMVEGLRKPRTKIDMGTFGEIREGTCFGCAATNAILHIMEAKEEEEIKGYIRTATDYVMPPLFQFENAMDYLRRGSVRLYNQYAVEYGFAQITPMPGLELPPLRNNYMSRYKGKQLNEYVKLAEYQLTV